MIKLLIPGLRRDRLHLKVYHRLRILPARRLDLPTLIVSTRPRRRPETARTKPTDHPITRADVSGTPPFLREASSTEAWDVREARRGRNMPTEPSRHDCPAGRMDRTGQILIVFRPVPCIPFVPK